MGNGRRAEPDRVLINKQELSVSVVNRGHSDESRKPRMGTRLMVGGFCSLLGELGMV